MIVTYRFARIVAHSGKAAIILWRGGYSRCAGGFGRDGRCNGGCWAGKRDCADRQVAEVDTHGVITIGSGKKSQGAAGIGSIEHCELVTAVKEKA